MGGFCSLVEFEMRIHYLFAIILTAGKNQEVYVLGVECKTAYY